MLALRPLDLSPVARIARVVKVSDHSKLKILTQRLQIDYYCFKDYQ